MDPIKKLHQHLQPQKNTSVEARTHQQNLAFLVGAVSVSLPLVMIVFGVAGLTCFYQSLSRFYYSPISGAFFIGCLGFIGGYLITWQGQSNLETWLATLAGPMAWLVATFPTSGAGCDEKIWTERIFADVPYAGDGTVSGPALDTPNEYHFFFDSAFTIHVGAALILFGVLAFFAMVVFTREIPERDRIKGNLTPEKWWRNFFYIASGCLIIASIGAIGIRIGLGRWFDLSWWERNNLTFWCEAVALFAFGFSWMVKGRFWGYALVDPKVDTPQRM